MARFVVGLSLALLLPSVTYAGSVQIQSSVAQSFSHSIVRTTAANIYGVILDTSATPAVRVYESTNGGSSWTQKDAAHAPTGAHYTEPSAAIDGNGVIHIAYWDSTSTSTGLRYVTFSTSTNSFSGDIAVVAVSYNQPTSFIHTSIAVDSNNVPHVLYEDGVRGPPSLALNYIDKVGGKWNRKVQIPDPLQIDDAGGEILIDQNNVPEICFIEGFNSYVYAAIGNSNKATSFTVQSLTSGFWPSTFPGIAMDNANNTWISYLRYDNVHQYGIPAVVEHKVGDSWSIWQAPVVDSSASTSSGG